MRREAQIFLEFMREANRQSVLLGSGAIGILKDVLEITQQEYLEVGEILKADIREAAAMSPHFSEINMTLERYPKPEVPS
jgi:hypothetical protein